MTETIITEVEAVAMDYRITVTHAKSNLSIDTVQYAIINYAGASSHRGVWLRRYQLEPVIDALLTARELMRGDK